MKNPNGDPDTGPSVESGANTYASASDGASASASASDTPRAGVGSGAGHEQPAPSLPGRREPMPDSFARRPTAEAPGYVQQRSGWRPSRQLLGIIVALVVIAAAVIVAYAIWHDRGQSGHRTGLPLMTLATPFALVGVPARSL
ncbi:MAG: hypothetical protein ABIQ39_05360 [Ilumatobacteraceae bacterium]